MADAAAAAAGTRTGRGGGSLAGSRTAAAAGSAPSCTRRGGTAAPPSRPAGAPGWARGPAPPRGPRAVGARCRPASRTTFAAASLRSACL